MTDPRLRTADRIEPPFKLNQFPKGLILSVAKDMIYSLSVRGIDSFEGPDWEQTFARAIGAGWKPSNIGLDDVVLRNCCWGAKTVKSNKPFSQSTVRLISGRNSPDFSKCLKFGMRE
jgi:hypothetical protein